MNVLDVGSYTTSCVVLDDGDRLKVSVHVHPHDNLVVIETDGQTIEVTPLIATALSELLNEAFHKINVTRQYQTKLIEEDDNLDELEEEEDDE